MYNSEYLKTDYIKQSVHTLCLTYKIQVAVSLKYFYIAKHKYKILH